MQRKAAKKPRPFAGSATPITTLGKVMYHNPDRYEVTQLGVVVKRQSGVTVWQAWSYRATSVCMPTGQEAWSLLYDHGDAQDLYAGEAALELHGAETEAYMHGLQAQLPCLYIVLRASSGDAPFDIEMITASPYEAQDYDEMEDVTVEKVPMPHDVIAWVTTFIETHHVDEVFVKRQRDKKVFGETQDGIGDARIVQTADVYRTPLSRRKERVI